MCNLFERSFRTNPIVPLGLGWAQVHQCRERPSKGVQDSDTRARVENKNTKRKQTRSVESEAMLLHREKERALSKNEKKKMKTILLSSI